MGDRAIREGWKFVEWKTTSLVLYCIVQPVNGERGRKKLSLPILFLSSKGEF